MDPLLVLYKSNAQLESTWTCSISGNIPTITCNMGSEILIITVCAAIKVLLVLADRMRVDHSFLPGFFTSLSLVHE